MSTGVSLEKRTFGGWRRPRKAGFNRFSMAATAVMFLGAAVTVLVAMVGGIWVGLAMFAFMLGLFFAVNNKDAHGVTFVERSSEKMAWFNRKRRGEDLHRYSLATPENVQVARRTAGLTGLPGVLGACEVGEFVDGFGRPFALVSWRGLGAYSVVLGSEPTGGANVDEETVDGWVSALAEWLASLSGEQQILQAQIVVESSPDYGMRLAREINANVVESAPALAHEMFEQVRESFPVGGTSVRAYIVFTISERAQVGAKPRSMEQMGADTAAYVAQMSQMLSATGAGFVTPVTAADLARVVRCSYDPASEVIFDQAALSGSEVELSFDEAGPVAAEAFWEAYRHDSGISQSWTMSGAPRQTVFSNVLKPLLSPDEGIARKRVALFYRPIDPGRAAMVADSDKTQADARVMNSTRPTAAAVLEQQNATRTTMEQAGGAGLVEFGMVMTATSYSNKDLQYVAQQMKSLSARAKLTIRPAYGAQDSMFVASLPLGMIPSSYSTLPSGLREYL